jgi:hypothetical protein
MNRSPQALRILLYAISALEGIAGLILIFAPNWVLAFAPTAIALSGFTLYLVQGVGVIALALGYLLCVAARQPARYVAVIDMLVFLAFAAAALNLYALGALGASAYFPASYLIARTVVQIAVGIALLMLRPRGPVRANVPAT